MNLYGQVTHMQVFAQVNTKMNLFGLHNQENISRI